ncbi:MAG: hypothetical protein CM15mV121_100 [uncultured marine virus]|nr:MAG: hypothetical protein CM15mV121_100 [uncultured marine virus]
MTHLLIYDINIIIKRKMIVKDLIKRLKKMPLTKEVYFFNHHNERLYSLDEGVWNIPNEK